MSHWPTLQIFHHIKLTLYNGANVILQFFKLIYATFILKLRYCVKALKNLLYLDAANVCHAEKRTKRSSNILLRLVRFSA